jgi:hypothetical protein
MSTGLRGFLRRHGVDVVSGEPWKFEAWPEIGGSDAEGLVNAKIAAAVSEVSAGNTQAIGQALSTVYDNTVKAAVVALSDDDAAGGILAWENPESVPILVVGFDLLVTTVATADCSVDAGVSADDATSDDTLIDGQDVHTATGAFRAAAAVRLDENEGTAPFLTISKASGSAADLAGFAVIQYVKLPVVEPEE